MGAVCACCSFKNEPAWPRKDGSVVARTITDKGGMIMFWAFVAGMVMCILSGIWYGNPKRLTHGSDWKGQICGYDEAVKDFKYMIFCGSPERVGDYPKYILEGSTACVQTCPTDTSMVINCLMPAFHNFTSYQGGEIGAIENVETLEMTLTQSVTQQSAYPTEQYGGRFCLPSRANPELRDLIINGPWGHYYRPLVSIGGLMDAWPLMLIAAGIACLLGYVFVFALSRCAGLIILAVMILSTLTSLAMGLVFFCAVVIDMDDPSSDYAEFNPIMSVFIGEEAKVYSIITGIILILISIVLGALTSISLAHIDEMVGLIAASCECLSKGFTLTLFPIIQAGSLLALLVAFLFIGLPIVASLGYLDYSEININGEGIQGLQRVWKRHPIQVFQFWYYFVGIFFVLECFVQFGHYVVAYTVASWYFIPGTDTPLNPNKAVQKATMGVGKNVEVRVAGVDANYGARQGTMMETSAGRMLVVPVGKKGPGLGRNDMVTSEFVKKDIPCGSLLMGSASVLFFHVGTIAVGAPVIFFLRPFRMFSQCVHGFLTKTSDPVKGPAHHDDPHSANVRGCFSLFSACLDQTFGKYSKTAFTELVLNGQDDFFDNAENSFQFLVKAGGSVAHLHGAMLLYELFGSLCITLTCGWVTLIIQDKCKLFSEETSPYYIEDKNASIIAAMIVSFAVAWTWMSLWTQAADVLLYCTAWNRRQLHVGEERGLPEAEMIEPVTVYCPQTIRALLPPYELQPAHEHGLHAHGIGQQGAIIAAMEHGAMNQHGSGAPDYSASIANAHTTAMKILG